TLFRSAIGVAGAADAGARLGPESIAHEAVPQERARFFDHVGDAPEVNRGKTLRTKNLAMFLCVLGQYARSHGGKFVSAHGVAVAIRAAHQTKRNSPRASRLSNHLH